MGRGFQEILEEAHQRVQKHNLIFMCMEGSPTQTVPCELRGDPWSPSYRNRHLDSLQPSMKEPALTKMAYPPRVSVNPETGSIVKAQSSRPARTQRPQNGKLGPELTTNLRASVVFLLFRLAHFYSPQTASLKPEPLLSEV